MLVVSLIKNDLFNESNNPCMAALLQAIRTVDPKLRLCSVLHVCLHLYGMWQTLLTTIPEALHEVDYWCSVGPVPVANVHRYESILFAVGAVSVVLVHCVALAGRSTRSDLRFHQLWLTVFVIKVVYYLCAILYDAKDPVRELSLLLRALMYLCIEAFSHKISVGHLTLLRSRPFREQQLQSQVTPSDDAAPPLRTQAPRPCGTLNCDRSDPQTQKEDTD